MEHLSDREGKALCRLPIRGVGGNTVRRHREYRPVSSLVVISVGETDRTRVTCRPNDPPAWGTAVRLCFNYPIVGAPSGLGRDRPLHGLLSAALFPTLNQGGGFDELAARRILCGSACIHRHPFCEVTQLELSLPLLGIGGGQHFRLVRSSGGQ